MASLTQRTWVWVDSGSWWWTGRPGLLPRVGHDWATELILILIMAIVRSLSCIWLSVTPWTIALRLLSPLGFPGKSIGASASASILPMNIQGWFALRLAVVASSPLNWQNKEICVYTIKSYQFSSLQFSHSVVSDSSRPHESQHARPPCPSPTPRAYSNSCPSSWWCHPAISSSVVPFSSCPQSLPASGCFLISQFFTWSSQSIGVSALSSVLPMNIYVSINISFT